MRGMPRACLRRLLDLHRGRATGGTPVAHAKDALLVAVGIVLAALGAELKESFKKLLDTVGRDIFDWLVSRNRFTRKAVPGYLHRLYDEYRQFHVSFQPGSSSEPMDMRQVHVRLCLATGVPGGGRTASATLADKERTVVLGTPGPARRCCSGTPSLAWVLARYRPLTQRPPLSQ